MTTGPLPFSRVESGGYDPDQVEEYIATLERQVADRVRVLESLIAAVAADAGARRGGDAPAVPDIRAAAPEVADSIAPPAAAAPVRQPADDDDLPPRVVFPAAQPAPDRSLAEELSVMAQSAPPRIEPDDAGIEIAGPQPVRDDAGFEIAADDHAVRRGAEDAGREEAQVVFDDPDEELQDAAIAQVGAGDHEDDDGVEEPEAAATEREAGLAVETVRLAGPAVETVRVAEADLVEASDLAVETDLRDEDDTDELEVELEDLEAAGHEVHKTDAGGQPGFALLEDDGELLEVEEDDGEADGSGSPDVEGLVWIDDDDDEDDEVEDDDEDEDEPLRGSWDRPDD